MGTAPDLPELRLERWGQVPYLEAQDRMEAVLGERIRGERPDTLILLEHPPTFTVGRSRGAGANILDPGEAPVVPVRRGGDVTFHGPGQVVGYPILALPEERLDLHAYLRGLEQLIIELLAEEHGLDGVRDPRNTGVWLEGRKVAAIGIACRRWVTWHGFALNVDVDLGWYQRINPCGMSAELVTRLADHVEGTPGSAEVADAIARRFAGWWARWRSGGGTG